MYQKTNRSAYAEKLRDPRWQKKRLEVMQRDDFRCQNCGDDTSTLNVHHFQYHGEPWDTPNNLLVTLCEPCHANEGETRPQEEKDLLSVLRSQQFLAPSVKDIANGFAAMKPFHSPDVMASIVSWMLKSPAIMNEMQKRYFDNGCRPF